MTILYFSPMACSLASRIALLLAGAEANFVSIDLKTHKLSDTQADYFDVTVKGKVPVLDREDGGRLSENAAVLQYIADLNPTAGLAPPAGSPERYKLQEWLSFLGTELHKAIVFLLYAPDVPEDVRRFAVSKAPEILAVVEDALTEGPFLIGDNFSVADAYLFWAVLLLRNKGIDLSAYSHLAAYFEKVSAIPEVRQAVGTEMALIAQARQTRTAR